MLGLKSVVSLTAAERGGSNSKGFQDFRTENGSRQGQILALAVLCVPCSLDSRGVGVLSVRERARSDLAGAVRAQVMSLKLRIS